MCVGEEGGLEDGLRQKEHLVGLLQGEREQGKFEEQKENLCGWNAMHKAESTMEVSGAIASWPYTLARSLGFSRRAKTQHSWILSQSLANYSPEANLALCLFW